MNILSYYPYLLVSLYAVFFFSFNLYFKKVKIDYNVEEILQSQIKKLGLKTELKISDTEGACFVEETSQIIISSGNDIKSASEGFHEIGHALYPQNRKIIIPYFLEKILELNFLIVSTLYFMKEILSGIFLLNMIVILSFISVLFFVYLLREEVFASSMAINLIRKENYFNKKTFIKIRMCLYHNLLGYIMPLVLSFFVFSSQLYSILIFNI